MEIPLIVDRNQANASLQIFSHSPLQSSYQASWKNIKLEYYELPPDLAPEHLPSQTAIVIYHQPLKVKRFLGGEVKDEQSKTGEIIVNPALVPHSACWEEPASFTLLLLEPEFIARAADELKHPERVELLPTFSHPDPVIYQMGLILKSHLESNPAVSQMYIDSVASFLAAHLLEHYCIDKQPIQKTMNSLSARDLQLTIDYINDHLKQNLSLTELADLIGMSHYHFGRLFKQSTGVSPYQYLIKCRLDRATRLLKNSNLSTTEIAQHTGFTSSASFCRTFRQHLSLTPQQYRQI